MSYKIAVASGDGKVINQHFGRATRFLIFEVTGGEYRLEKLLDTKPFCESGEHDEGKLTSSAEALSGCRAVLVSQIGKGAEQMLNKNGIEAYAIGDLIENALVKLISYYSKIDGGRKGA